MLTYLNKKNMLTEIYQNLYELCDNIGERYTGTKGEKKAADYIRKKLLEYKIHHVQIQEYPLKTWEPKSPVLEVFLDNQPFLLESLMITLTESAEATGELIDFTRDSWFEINHIKNLKGKIVLIDNLIQPPFYLGVPISIENKASCCKEKGCEGIIIKNAVNQGLLLKWVTLREDYKGIPCCSISFEDGERLQRLLKYKEKIHIHLVTEAVRGNAFSQNVIGQVNGISKEIIVIGAHYDTVIDSVGALDNACGVAVLMELARIISNIVKEKAIKKNIIFAFFGSEEIGHQGSEYFVREFTDKKQQNIQFMINLDEIGAGRMKGYVLNTSPKLKNILNNVLRKVGSPYCVHTPFPFETDKSADGYSFAKQGIETIGFWRWRYEAESPTNRYRHINFDEGESMAHHFRHTKADTLDKVDLVSLNEYIQGIMVLLDILSQY